jgi:hypothetical protein
MISAADMSERSEGYRHVIGLARRNDRMVVCLPWNGPENHDTI